MKWYINVCGFSRISYNSIFGRMKDFSRWVMRSDVVTVLLRVLCLCQPPGLQIKSSSKQIRWRFYSFFSILQHCFFVLSLKVFIIIWNVEVRHLISDLILPYSDLILIFQYAVISSDEQDIIYDFSNYCLMIKINFSNNIILAFLENLLVL